jgi:hypothetical protein
MLSRHPDVERKVRAEVERVLGGRPPTFKEAGALEYTKWTIHEVMRLHPPVWMMEREAAVLHRQHLRRDGDDRPDDPAAVSAGGHAQPPPVVPKPTFTLRPMYRVPVRAVPWSGMQG